MYIEWFGQTFIRLQMKSPQNGDSHLLIDPYQTKNFGMRQPKMDADMVLLTVGDLDTKLNIQGNPFVITHPGEYETKQVFVYGVPEIDDNNKLTGQVMYVIEGEEMTIGHLGPIHQTQLTEQQLEYFENVDVLLVPVGGGNSLSPKQAARLVQQIDPRLVIPVHYAWKGSGLKLAGVDEFIKELGQSKSERVDKLRVVKKELPVDETRLVIIEI
jgi:L-ascorbate metabolism protein UlaG (beta-lactamase superfamily)